MKDSDDERAPTFLGDDDDKYPLAGTILRKIPKDERQQERPRHKP